jgi:hypothetical protein
MFRRGRLAAILATPIFAAVLLSPASAAEKKEKGPEAGKDMVVMGCLTTGSQPDEYQIKTDDKTFVLVGYKEKLAKHVGHIVTLSGHVDTEREKQVAGKPGDFERFKISSWTKTGSACP